MSILSDLLSRALQVKQETVEEANSSLRVGSLFYDLISFFGSQTGTGTIPTKTSDLTNDGPDGVYPYVTDDLFSMLSDAFSEAQIDIANIQTILDNALLTQSVTSSAEIDFSKNLTVINYTTATGDVALTTFVNLPAAPKVHSVFFRHNRATSLNVALRTASLTVGDNTYTFTNMDATTVAVPAGKTIELSYMIIQNAANSFEIITKYSIQV